MVLVVSLLLSTPSRVSAELLPVSLTVMPFLASLILKERDDAHGNVFLRGLNRGIAATYAPVLHRALALWFAIAVPTWLVLLAFNLPLDFSASLFIMGFAAVSSVVPTPGGAAGAFHTATAASLIFLNVDQNVAGAETDFFQSVA